MAATLDDRPSGERIRIASVVKRLHIGGDEMRLLTFARCVDRDRFEHVVIAVQGPTDERDERLGPMLRRFREAGVEVVVLNRDIVSVSGIPTAIPTSVRRRLADLLTAAAVLRSLVAILRERRIDVVDGRLNFGTVFGLAAARLARVPVVVSTLYYPEHWRRPRLLEPFGQLAMALADATVTDADATVAAFAGWRWSARKPLVMIPNGVAAATSTRSRAEMRDYFGLPSDPRVRVVGCVCRMIEGKGYPTFLRAARQILDAEPDVAFLLCGYAEEPTFRDSLVALAASLDLGDRVVVTQYPGPVGDALAALDLYVRVSVMDSSPMGVHEAMSVRLPIVVSEVGGVAELVSHEDSALLVPPEDPDALGAAVLRVLRDEDLATRLADRGHARYLQRHTPQQMTRATERLFSGLLANRR